MMKFIVLRAAQVNDANTKQRKSDTAKKINIYNHNKINYDCYLQLTVII